MGGELGDHLRVDAPEAGAGLEAGVEEHATLDEVLGGSPRNDPVHGQGDQLVHAGPRRAEDLGAKLHQRGLPHTVAALAEEAAFVVLLVLAGDFGPKQVLVAPLAGKGLEDDLTEHPAGCVSKLHALAGQQEELLDHEPESELGLDVEVHEGHEALGRRGEDLLKGVKLVSNLGGVDGGLRAAGEGGGLALLLGLPADRGAEHAPHQGAGGAQALSAVCVLGLSLQGVVLGCVQLPDEGDRIDEVGIEELLYHELALRLVGLDVQGVQDGEHGFGFRGPLARRGLELLLGLLVPLLEHDLGGLLHGGHPVSEPPPQRVVPLLDAQGAHGDLGRQHEVGGPPHGVAGVPGVHEDGLEGVCGHSEGGKDDLPDLLVPVSGHELLVGGGDLVVRELSVVSALLKPRQGPGGLRADLGDLVPEPAGDLSPELLD
mmetsp:Transcript_9360/g.33551  ORF Transcript_9360/g.33551 Transcript_9360/m.33551 type:complete len:430 (-) Transcript_9360:516-1805(-)